MAWTYSVNNRPSTGSVAMYLVLANFIAAGWVVRSSSDGTTYNSSGNQITGGGTGANGLGNNYAWFRIQDPGGTREFVVERGTTSYNWAIKYSPAAKFTGGAPAATAPPSATDEVKVLGDITGSPVGAGGTFASLWDTVDNTYLLHTNMGDSTVAYAFWIYAIKNATPQTPVGGWFMDWMQSPDTGDLDPTVHYASGTNAGLVKDCTNSAVAKAFFVSITSANFKTLQIQKWNYGSNMTNSQAGSNGWNYFPDLLPAMWASTAASTGWKGWSSLFSITMEDSGNPGTICNVGYPPAMGQKAYINVKGGLAPWPVGVDAVT